MKYFKFKFVGYGSESVVGSISEQQYNYWIKNKDYLSEYLNVFDKKNKKIPVNAHIYKDWFELDDIAHVNGPLLDDPNNPNFEIIQIDKNNLEISREAYPFHTGNFKYFKLGCTENSLNHEDKTLRNKFYFIGHGFEKGVYTTNELINTDSKEIIFNKMKFDYTVIDGFKILNKIIYDNKIYLISGDTLTHASEMNVFKGIDL